MPIYFARSHAYSFFPIPHFVHIKLRFDSTTSPLPAQHAIENNNNNPFGPSKWLPRQPSKVSKQTSEQNNIPYHSHFIRMFFSSHFMAIHVSYASPLGLLFIIATPSMWIWMYICIIITSVSLVYIIYIRIRIYKYIKTVYSRSRNTYNRTFWPWNLT